MEQSHNTDTGDTNGTVPVIPPREALINTAISFLQNPNVARSSIVQKQKFLRSKGLSETEIQIACERACVFTKDPSTIINMGIAHQPPVLPLRQSMAATPLSTFQRVRDILSSTALIAGLAYAVYMVYKRFIEPLLFGNKKKKKKTVEESIDQMDRKIEKNINDLNQELRSVKDKFRSTFNTDQMLHREMISFKNDLDAIKGLLLNRKQFSSPVVPPSIPAWQLQSQRSVAVGDTTTAANDADKNDDNGSADGSGGSSETEVVTKHSDSSLELIS